MAQPDFQQARRIIYLITRFIDGSIDFAELQELDSWRKEKPRHEALFQKSIDREKLAKAIEEMQGYDTEGSLEQLMQKIKKQEAKRQVVTRLWQKLLVAAISLSLIGTFCYQYFYHKSPQNTLAINPHPNFIPSGSNKAILTLANGQKIDLDDSKAGTIARQSGAIIQKKNGGLITYVPSRNTTDTTTSYNLIETPRGGQYRLQLPDGTKVWLNAASSLKFPSNFKRKQRIVTLTGEGYFEVVHNAKQPFIVKTNSETITDIGTTFNVNTYIDEPHNTTTLIEGSILLAAENKKAVLKPGQQAIVGSRNITISQGDLRIATAWKDGQFRFHKTDIRNVLRQVSRWYNISIEYQGAAPDITISGGISRQEDLSAVLKILQLSEVHFIQQDHKLIILNQDH
jgi:ferric-dicitrate binding protein FerR (iron transport regulator)